MLESLISGDNHIDLTYCPSDLWSSQAPAEWKQLVPRVQELDNGCYWFVEEQDWSATWGNFPRMCKAKSFITTLPRPTG
jgi:hypothetical protein